ncbi:MAG: hypothetical protein ACLGIG_10360 [Actinomycetes bacterium]
MPDDVVAYLLLALNLLVVAIILSLPVLALWWLIGTPRPLPDPPPELLTPSADPPAPGERVLRRCQSCGVLWKGRPGDDASCATLKLRRWMRRRTRARKTDTPAWAKRRGWSRCPSCLSRDVRTSRAARSPR